MRTRIIGQPKKKGVRGGMLATTTLQETEWREATPRRRAPLIYGNACEPQERCFILQSAPHKHGRSNPRERPAGMRQNATAHQPSIFGRVATLRSCSVVQMNCCLATV